jgi:hypothetical protein
MSKLDQKHIQLLRELEKLEENYKQMDEFLGEVQSNPNNEIGTIICCFTKRPRMELPNIFNNVMSRGIVRTFKVLDRIADMDSKCMLN